MASTPLNEAAVIGLMKRGQRSAPRPYGIGDDGAMIRNGLIVTQDTMVEGVHFNELLSPADIGYKIVAVNVSDISAMGRLPDWATLSLSLPDSTTMEWVETFSTGLREGLKKWNIYLIGGDTTRSPKHITLSMAMGSRTGSTAVWQSGAEVGDTVWVTGTLGDAAYGFHHPDNALALEVLRRPEPPVELGAALSAIGAVHSMTDISDGLHRDLTTLCQASGVGATINPALLPRSSILYNVKNDLDYMVGFGEDYQLLFTASEGCDKLIRQLARRHGNVVVTNIGRITSSTEIVLQDADWPKPTFSHF